MQDLAVIKSQSTNSQDIDPETLISNITKSTGNTISSLQMQVTNLKDIDQIKSIPKNANTMEKQWKKKQLHKSKHPPPDFQNQNYTIFLGIAGGLGLSINWCGSLTWKVNRSCLYNDSPTTPRPGLNQTTKPIVHTTRHQFRVSEAATGQ